MAETVNSLGGKPKGEETISLTVSDFQKAITAAVAQAVSASSRETSKIVMEAISELRKPYVDPNKAANDKMMAEQTRQLHERLKRNLEIDRASCAHLQGSNALSEEQGNKLSIIWHQLPVGTWLGICTNCQREFWPSDPDYMKYRARKSGNRPSAAGQHQFVDTKSWEKKQHPEPWKYREPVVA